MQGLVFQGGDDLVLLGDDDLVLLGDDDLILHLQTMARLRRKHRVTNTNTIIHKVISYDKIY